METIKLSKEQRKLLRERRILKKHFIRLMVIAVGFMAFILSGALFPDFYPSIDRLPPVIQIILPLIPITVFAVWRLKKMMHL